MAQGGPEKTQRVEVRGFLIKASKKISVQKLYELHLAFHRRLKMIESPEGDTFIYTFDDQLFSRFEALLPLMPILTEQVMIVPKQEWRELKLEEALGKALQ